ncbi:MAG: Na+-transporting NADH:ubiquinone oxidoreductase subunit C [Sphingobacteriales bacterium]|jgi:Na+-transporting NADH:ubiquinone oxidoreductase subunit C
MALDKNSNGFTFGFAIILVVVVGTALSLTSMGLKPLQKKNEADKKMIDILGAVQVQATRENAKVEFAKYVKESIVLDFEGNERDSVDAFSVDIKKEFKDKAMDVANKNFPLYMCTVEGSTYYVLPMAGNGLWGPIWGFIGLNDDFKTIFGATFDHKGETPGLGAEIKTDAFQSQFANKEFNLGNDMLFEVTKGAGSSSTIHQVDGITGGTITSKGVQEMINRSVGVYNLYFSKKATLAKAEIQEIQPELEVEVTEDVQSTNK